LLVGLIRVDAGNTRGARPGPGAGGVHPRGPDRTPVGEVGGQSCTC